MKKSLKALMLTSIFLFSMLATGVHVSAKPEGDPSQVPFVGFWGNCGDDQALGDIQGIFTDGKIYANLRSRQGQIWGTLLAYYGSGCIEGKIIVHKPIVRANRDPYEPTFDVCGKYWNDGHNVYMRLSIEGDYRIPQWMSNIWVRGVLIK
jgi:hypothetical protein